MRGLGGRRRSHVWYDSLAPGRPARKETYCVPFQCSVYKMDFRGMSACREIYLLRIKVVGGFDPYSSLLLQLLPSDPPLPQSASNSQIRALILADEELGGPEHTQAELCCCRRATTRKTAHRNSTDRVVQPTCFGTD